MGGVGVGARGGKRREEKGGGVDVEWSQEQVDGHNGGNTNLRIGSRWKEEGAQGAVWVLLGDYYAGTAVLWPSEASNVRSPPRRTTASDELDSTVGAPPLGRPRLLNVTTWPPPIGFHRYYL
ncbi:unnamed protein product [Chondrus crispus]|uniref:Uncharacterized protein n=1 Tax=Chondrus crispus TaxID=2769 RepID=R7Q6A0_CHOCR|nr:unnamed protein product [Chondrus crispus]CDF33534.1 unnamed protein product [Chondrus crispus]|eukprot:XP_005713337.1 unnamed protein product [Chondrus crispus]